LRPKSARLRSATLKSMVFLAGVSRDTGEAEGRLGSLFRASGHGLVRKAQPQY
jgi:hypothetical protein